jgi:hypothetical protein
MTLENIKDLKQLLQESPQIRKKLELLQLEESKKLTSHLKQQGSHVDSSEESFTKGVAYGRFSILAELLSATSDKT